MEVDDPEHFCPPLNGPFWVLERVLLPPPHVLEQDPQEPQAFQVQSTEKMMILILAFKTFFSVSPGQSFVPQARSSADSPMHSSPPFLAHTFTNLDRI